MSPSWLEKWRSKKGSSSRPTPLTEPHQPLQPEPEPSDRATVSNEQTPQSVQGRLWNPAYDKVEEAEPKLVAAVENLLSSQLTQGQPNPREPDPESNDMSRSKEEKRRRMKQLIHAGLERTRKEAATKEKIGGAMDTVSSVKGIISKAVNVAHEAALAWVGICFTMELLSNPITEAHSNRKGIKYVLSRMEWYWELADLLLDANRAETATAALRDELEKHVVELYQKLLSYQMRSICVYYSDSGHTIVRDLFMLDDWKGQLDDIHKAEESVRQDYKQYNSERIISKLDGTLDAARLMEGKLGEISSAIQAQTTQQDHWRESDRQRQCLTDFYETDPGDVKTRIQETKEPLLEASFLWILDNAEYRRWSSEPQNRLLWIKGDAGKGKTMLMCGIIDKLQPQGNNGRFGLLSFFFCQATEPRLSNATSVLRGLIYGLVRQYPPLIAHVEKEYDCGGKQRFQDGNAWQVMSRIMRAILNDPNPEAMTLMVDAVDECNDDQTLLLGFIADAVVSCRAKWIITSREWPSGEFEERLITTTHEYKLSLELNEDATSAAVRTYIQHWVDKLARQKSYDNKMRHEVEQYLGAHAHGTFLWVALVCKELANAKVAKWNTLSRLKKLPSSLTALYERMMDQIQDSEDGSVYKQILTTVSIAYRPVTLEELALLVEPLEHFYDDVDTLEEAVRSCGSFLTLRNGTVYFVHQSAKDFLLGPASAKTIPLGAERSHWSIFSRSLDLLLRTDDCPQEDGKNPGWILRRDPYRLCDPGVFVEDITAPKPNPLAPIHYLCVYWVRHLVDSKLLERNESLVTGALVERFLRAKSLYWLEALSLLRSVPDGVRALRQLDRIVTLHELPTLVNLTRDILRFILFNRSVIEIALLQAYTSALIFSPTYSEIRESFQDEIPRWIVARSKIRDKWDTRIQTLEGHKQLVKSLAFAPNKLVSTSLDMTIRIWDSETGNCFLSLENYSGLINLVEISSCGQYLASASLFEKIKLWHTATGACLGSVKRPEGGVVSMSFLCEKQLALVSAEGSIILLDLENDMHRQELKKHHGTVKNAAFSSDGKLALVGSDMKSNGRTVRLWNSVTDKGFRSFELDHDERITAVSLSTNGRRLAVVSDTESARFWDLETNTCMDALSGNYRCHSLDYSPIVGFSPDGKLFASTVSQLQVKLWDASNGILLQTFAHSVVSLVFLEAPPRLALGLYTGRIELRDLAQASSPIAIEEDLHDLARQVAFSEDGSKLASLSHGSSSPEQKGSWALRLWDPVTCTCLQASTPPPPRACPQRLTFSPDGQKIALTYRSNSPVSLFDGTTGKLLQELGDHNSFLTDIAFSRDCHTIASSFEDGMIKFWDLNTSKCFQKIKNPPEVYSIAISTTNRLLALVEGNGLGKVPDEYRIKVRDLATGACLQSIATDRERCIPLSLAFSPNEQQLGVSKKKGVIKVFEWSKGECLITSSGNGNITRTISFDPNDPSRLRTNIGTLKRLPDSNGLNSLTTYKASYEGYHISRDGTWIMDDTKRLIWIPPEHRPIYAAVAGSTLAFSTDSGRMLIFRLAGRCQ